MSREAAAEVARLVASDDEIRRVVQAASLDPLQTLTLVFSAKESLFKALYPPTRRRFDFLDCELVRLDPEARGFGIRFKRAVRRRLRESGVLRDATTLADGEVRTGVLVPPA